MESRRRSEVRVRKGSRVRVREEGRRVEGREVEVRVVEVEVVDEEEGGVESWDCSRARVRGWVSETGCGGGAVEGREWRKEVSMWELWILRGSSWKMSVWRRPDF